MNLNKPCPFCDAGQSMLYAVDGKDFHGFTRPEIFCDGCKASVYVEDSSSTGENEKEDYRKQLVVLQDTWNNRGD